jgi:hypothetical protein
MHETCLAAPPFAEDTNTKGRFKTGIPDHVCQGIDVTLKPQPIFGTMLIRSEIDATRHGPTPYFWLRGNFSSFGMIHKRKS